MRQIAATISQIAARIVLKLEQLLRLRPIIIQTVIWTFQRATVTGETSAVRYLTTDNL